ncbi:hypothetical protein [Streptomyces sp. NPDC004726]
MLARTPHRVKMARAYEDSNYMTVAFNNLRTMPQAVKNRTSSSRIYVN